MVQRFEDLVNNMVNIGIGAAATAAETSKAMLDGFAAKGSEVRDDAAQTDFGRSMADIFTQAGGAFTDATERLNTKGETVAERILDELILARVRPMSKSDRIAFLAHVRDLVDAVDGVTVEVESDEPAESASTGGDTAANVSSDTAADEADTKA